MVERKRLRADQSAGTPVTIVQADVLEGLATLPDESVHCVVTSPPYYGLRDYGTAEWEGGDPGCDHVDPDNRPHSTYKIRNELRQDRAEKQFGTQFRELCGKCGARRQDQQLGLEPTPQDYVDRIVEVFREVRRVLRRDGTCWLNLGDSYTSGGRGDYGGWSPDSKQATHTAIKGARRPGQPPELKLSKQLQGIPWRVALALQADGWVLRQDIIWAKPNPMPESVADRCTKGHEYLFLLTRSERYYYDNEAIAEATAYPISDERNISGDYSTGSGRNDGGLHRSGGFVTGETRNRRSVWPIASQPYSDAHFAVFPPRLPELCIRAGTSNPGCCSRCGVPWVRVTERQSMKIRRSSRTHSRGRTRSSGTVERPAESRTVGWEPGCGCGEEQVPCTVLDPFLGAGTTVLVANRLGRRSIGIELSPEYAEMAAKRVRGDALLEADQVWLGSLDEAEERLPRRQATLF